MLLCLCVSAWLCHSEDAGIPSTCWRGAAHDGVSGWKLQPPAAWPKKLNVVWQADAGSGYSSPISDGTHVYLQSRTEKEELLSAYDVLSGNRAWQTKIADIKDPQTHDPAPTPAFSSERIFVHSMTGTVLRVNAKDGHIDWTRNLPAELKGESFRNMYGVAASPLVVGKETIVLPIGDKETGKALALKQSDGTTAWEQAVSAPGYGSFQPLEFNGKQFLAVLLYHELAVFKLDGEKAAPAFSFKFPGGGDGNAATPAALGGNRVLLTNHETTVALTVLPGETKCEEAWRLNVGGNLSSPVFFKDRIYLHDQGDLLCLDPASGKTLSSLEMGAQYCALLAWDRVLFCRLHDGTVNVVDIDGPAMKQLASYSFEGNGDSWSALIPVSPTRFVMRTGEKLMCLTWEK